MEDKSFSLREIKVMDSWKYTWIISSWSCGYWLFMMMWVKCLMMSLSLSQMLSTFCDMRNGDYPYDESWSFRTWYIDLFWVIYALHESWKKSSIKWCVVTMYITKMTRQKDSIIACVKILQQVKSCRADLHTEETYFAFSFQYGSTSGRVIMRDRPSQGQQVWCPTSWRRLDVNLLSSCVLVIWDAPVSAR